MYSTIAPGDRQIIRAAPVWQLTDVATCPHTAREQVSRTLRDWGLPWLVDDAALIVSELVTNAAKHGRGPVWHTLRQVTLHDTVFAVHLAVGDAGEGWVGGTVHPAGWEETSGRGLEIMDALASDWGHRRLATGHLVWADLLVSS
ncbi:ATP-binding protein [Streptomyces sp. NPDC006512]|uniref:ATP-binding protein n=1 Tax=Streptomyces sp. NPDC006512 TaxID=3154307 RepID=UPI0033BEE410